MTAEQNQKKTAGEFAATLVKSGMNVGLGTGSTAEWATRKIGELLRDGHLRDVRGVATSKATELLALHEGITLMQDDFPQSLDICIDGADAVDRKGDLIKGGGGAMLREKIVAEASLRRVIVVTEDKLCENLLAHTKLPIEVCPFGWQWTAARLERLGGRITLRADRENQVVQTDQGNFILDGQFPQEQELRSLAQEIRAIPGALAHGLFLNLADLVVIGENEQVRTWMPKASGESS